MSDCLRGSNSEKKYYLLLIIIITIGARRHSSYVSQPFPSPTRQCSCGKWTGGLSGVFNRRGDPVRLRSNYVCFEMQRAMARLFPHINFNRNPIPV